MLNNALKFRTLLRGEFFLKRSIQNTNVNPNPVNPITPMTPPATTKPRFNL